MKQRMLAWLCAGILGLGCWGLPAAAADDTTEPTTQVTTEAETETESSKFSTKRFGNCCDCIHACNRWNSNGCICVPVEKAEIFQPEIKNGELPSNSVETELERKCIALWQIIPDNLVLYAKSHSIRKMMLLFAQNAERLTIGRAGSIMGTASMCICTKTAEAGNRSKFHYQNRKQHRNTPLPSLRNGKSCASGILRTLRHDFRGERTAANSTAKPTDLAAKCTGYLLRIRPNEDYEGERLEDLANFVRTNTIYYVPAFKKFRETGSKLTMNLISAVFPQLYLPAGKCGA